MIEEAMDTHYEAINWALGEIHHFGRSDGALRTQLLAGAEADLKQWHAWLEAQLGNAPWLGGDRFGWADASVLPHLLGSEAFGLGPAPESGLGAYLARGQARPSVQAGREEIAALGNGGASLDAYRAALEAGLFKREYRDHRLEWMVRHGGLAVVQEGLRPGQYPLHRALLRRRNLTRRPRLNAAAAGAELIPGVRWRWVDETLWVLDKSAPAFPCLPIAPAPPVFMMRSSPGMKPKPGALARALCTASTRTPPDSCS